jgi:hypothetical protein
VFTAPQNWDVEWTYDCSAYGSEGNFHFIGYTSGGGITDIAGPNQLGPGGSGTEYYHDGGSIYLEINSECSLSIKAVTA